MINIQLFFPPALLASAAALLTPSARAQASDAVREKPVAARTPDAASDGPRIQGKLAVLDLTAVNAPPALAATLTESIAAEAGQVPGLQVMSKSDIKAVLTFEMQRQLLGCSDDTCLADIGGKLGADVLLSGSLGKVGEIWVLNLRLVDAKTAQSLGRREQQVEGGEVQLLASALNLTSLLLTGKEKATTGFLKLVASEDGAKVVIDGQEKGMTPLAEAIPLRAGVRKVLVHKDGFIPWELAVTVKPAETQAIDAKLIPTVEVAGSDYTPWIWTAIGVGVATLGGGLFFGNRAETAYESYSAASTLLDIRKFQKETQDNARLANILFAGAAAAGLLGGALLVIDASSSPGDGAGISVGGSF